MLGEDKVNIIIDEYQSPKNIAVMLALNGNEYYDDVSRNIKPLQADHFAVDVNNNPGIDKWLEDNNIAHNTGYMVNSGFVSYPIYALNNAFKNDLTDIPSVE